MDLFTCESLSVFAFPFPAATAEKPEPADAIQASEFAHLTGDYENALKYADQVISGFTNPRARSRALLSKATTYFDTGHLDEAQSVIGQISSLAAESDDSFVRAVQSFAQGLTPESRMIQPLDEVRNIRRNSLKNFLGAAEAFREQNEPEYTVRALTKAARVKFTEGQFFSAMDTIEEAANLVRAHGLSAYVGRMQVLVAGTCGDQGYREGIAERLRTAIDWCKYSGDATGKIEGLVAMGRLLAYEMPGNQPELADEPDYYLRTALEEAETRGLTAMAATIESLRTWLFQKAGRPDPVKPKEEREELVATRNEDAARVTAQIRLNTISRLYDGVEDSHDAFFVYDALRNDKGEIRDFNTLYMNRSAARIYEQSGRQVYLYSEARLLPPLSGLDDAIRSAANERTSFEDAHEAGSLWLQRKVMPSGDGAVVLLRDITAEKHIESALRNAAHSAEQSERAKSAFLASMSHEIRTPLNGVLGLARMLSETNLDDTQRAYVDDIVLSGDLLLALVGDVLDLSKIESHEMRLAPTAVSLPSLVASIVKLFRGQAEENGTILSFRVDSAVPDMVEADGVRLRQILANLVGNAVKFTREGEVEIRVTTDAGNGRPPVDTPSDSEIFSESQTIVFEVRDTGIGIPADRVAHIFDRFQQASDPGYGGTGLGLTITRALTELMKGDVQVTSEVGQGSVFRVRLPLREVKEINPVQTAKASQRFEGRRVLLVDDNRVNLLVSSHTLRKFGCEVTIAEDGSKALDLIAQNRFDIIFMDVRMPIMNGLEATQELRRRETGGPRTPVVALTAGALLQEQQECFDAGMDDFATKPITSDSIGEVLARWL